MRTTIAVLAAVATVGALGVSGAAFAAGPGEKQQSRCETILTKLAQKRGVTVAELETTIKARILERIDRSMAAGKIDRARADSLKQKLASGPLCSTARGVHAAMARHQHRNAVRTMLTGAAGYLGLTRQELRTELKAGKSVAEVATARGKDVAGLPAAMLAAVEAKLDRAVAEGKMTAERRATLLERYTELAKRLVDRKPPVSG